MTTDPELIIRPESYDYALTLVSSYRLVLEADDELGFVGSSVELPTVFADGRTPDACVAATKKALALAAAVMMETGANPPSPSLLSKREHQINVRVAAHEKFLLQEAARRRGYRGLADFVRAVALVNSHSL